MKFIIVVFMAAIAAGCSIPLQLATDAEKAHEYKLSFPSMTRDAIWAGVMEWTTITFNQSTLDVPVPPISYSDRTTGTVIATGRFDRRIVSEELKTKLDLDATAKIYYRAKDGELTVKFYIYSSSSSASGAKDLRDSQMLHREAGAIYTRWIDDLKSFILKREP